MEQDISTGNPSEVIELVNILRESALRLLEKAPTSTAIELARMRSMSQDTKDFIPNEYLKLLFTPQIQLASYIRDFQDDEVWISLKNLTDSSFPNYSTPQTIKAIVRVEKKINNHNDGQFPPPIRSKTIRSQVFTHKSSFEKYLAGNGMHNGRLAFLGDSILRNCITKILLRKLKQIDEDELFIIRSKLMSDVQLTKWVELYQWNRDGNYISHDSLKKYSPSPYAELFKAYIGGLLEDEFDIGYVESWLQTLIEPLIDKFNTSRISAPIDELLLLIGTDKAIVYETVSIDPYCVNVIINGRLCGTGTGSDFMRAKSSAAREALNNPGMYPTTPASPVSNSHTASNEPTSKVTMEPHINIRAKNDLYAILGRQSLVPEYEVNKVDDTFHAIVTCKKVVLGEGKDRSKKWASQRAAMAALSNKLAIAKLTN